jgi:metal-dependent hydrolase (beta-lactamase superfamily II)
MQDTILKNIKRMILTHVHIDHIQAANEVKRLSVAKLYSHWTEVGYLAHDKYQGAPSHATIQNTLDKVICHSILKNIKLCLELTLFKSVLGMVTYSFRLK